MRPCASISGSSELYVRHNAGNVALSATGSATSHVTPFSLQTNVKIGFYKARRNLHAAIRSKALASIKSGYDFPIIATWAACRHDRVHGRVVLGGVCNDGHCSLKYDNIVHNRIP